MTPRSVPEWIGARPETPPPPRVKARLIVAQGGICGCGCGMKLGVAGEAIEFDHATALILGGENRETNLRALRRPCHTCKTAQDVRQKAIEARKRAKHFGTFKPPVRKIPGSKGTGMRKPFNRPAYRVDE